MKTSITTKDPQPPAITYPCLMQSPKGLIVLFTTIRTGTAVHGGESNVKTGDYSESWIPAADSHHWTRFTGTLNLSNS